MTPCGHQYHMQCFQSWYRSHRICPYCRKGIKLPKLTKLLSKPCEICGTGPSNFVTRCHHFIHIQRCTNGKRRYGKCAICNTSISKSQYKEIVNTRHVWTDEELDTDAPMPILDLALLVCEEPHLMEKMSLNHLVKRLLENGFGIDDYIGNGRSTLINSACITDNITAIKELIILGSDPNSDVFYFCSPVNYAVRSNNIDLFIFLLEHGANIAEFESQILVYGLKSLNEDGLIFEILIELGKNTWNMSFLLMDAVETVYYNAVARLIDIYGFDVNEVNSNTDGYTPFIKAVKSFDPKMLDVLAERGANIMHKTKDGADAFEVACNLWNYQFNRAVENGVMAKLFEIMKLDPNRLDSKGISPLAYAASRGNLDFFNFLVKNGADIRQPTLDGSLPINYALLDWHYNIIERIIDLGFNINEFYGNGNSPLLHFLAKSRYYRICSHNSLQKLFSIGADFSILDREGRTALHIAALHRNIKFMDEFIKIRVECINCEDNLGKRPIDLTDDRRTIEWLLEHGSLPKRKWYHIFTQCIN